MKEANSVKNIVVLGAGFAGMYTLKRLRKLFGYSKNYRFILVNDRSYFLFTPLLHEVATGGVAVSNVVEPLRKVARKYFDRFILGEVIEIDLSKKIVVTSRINISYDYLVLTLGSETFFYDIKGAEKYSYTLKTLDDAIQLKERFLCAFERASMIDDDDTIKKMLTFVVVGGGPTGVELAAEMCELFKITFTHYYDKKLVDKCQIILIQNGNALLPQFSEYFHDQSYKTLVEKHKVRVVMNDGVSEVGEDFVRLKSGELISTYNTIWTAGVVPRHVKFTQNVPKDEKGRIIVNQFGQIAMYPEVFVGGDMSAYLFNGEILPATAQVASKEGPNIAENIYSMAYDKALNEFKYNDSGTLVSLGRWKALAEIKNLKFKGHFAWWLWRTIYLMKLISFPKKLKVVIDWTVGIFTSRDIST